MPFGFKGCALGLMTIGFRGGLADIDNVEVSRTIPSSFVPSYVL